ncbi:RHS repeat-associated core domain-containing protein [Elizabethkingia meningoseptica]|uniref:RHS repeat-associated core domain-containing protein n=1 Tax=Elizabethkingia meningoseptica TaxID=238 RepID=UPI0023B0F291|nr:RHS repeat-associated core domain-containing protein [Elizabethkingia meningoseptica]
MKHEGYNNASLANSAYKYKYQGQELQENGWYSFKWRNYIPELGRFFNVDPLSEKYSYQSHYNFSENRVIDGRELEGLEWVKSTNINQDGTKTHILNANIKLVNDSKNFTSDNMKDFQTSYINNMKNSYNGALSSGDKIEIGKINFETVKSVKDGDYSISIVDQVLDTQGKPVSFSEDTEVRGMIQLYGQYSDPIDGYIGNSQQNNMQVVPSGKNRTGEAAAHETGHTFGLRHQTDSSPQNTTKDSVGITNLMHAPRMGNAINQQQRDIIIKNIPDEKKTNP